MSIPALPTQTAARKTVSTPEIVLIAVLAVTVIVIAGIFVVLTVNQVSSIQENHANQTNFSNFAFKIPGEKAQTKLLEPDLTVKTISISIQLMLC